MITYGLSILLRRSTIIIVSLSFNKLSHNTLMFVKIKVQRLVWTDPCFVSSQIEIGRTGACNVPRSSGGNTQPLSSPFVSTPLLPHTLSLPSTALYSQLHSVLGYSQREMSTFSRKRKEINKRTKVLCAVLIC